MIRRVQISGRGRPLLAHAVTQAQIVGSLSACVPSIRMHRVPEALPLPGKTLQRFTSALCEAVVASCAQHVGDQLRRGREQVLAVVDDEEHGRVAPQTATM